MSIVGSPSEDIAAAGLERAMESVTGLERVVLVIEYVALAKTPPTHAEIAVGLGIAKSTLTALLQMLLKTGYIEVVGRRYVLGPRFLALSYRVATRAIGDVALRSALRPTIEAIAGQTGETVILAIEIGGNREHPGFMLAVDYVESSHPLRYVPTIGQPAPMYTSTAGKALLAASNRPLRPMIDPRRSAQRSVDMDAIEKELKLVRKRGHALRAVDGLVTVAVALRDETGWPLGAISVVGPTQRLGADGGRILPIVFECLERTRAQWQAALNGPPPQQEP